MGWLVIGRCHDTDVPLKMFDTYGLDGYNQAAAFARGQTEQSVIEAVLRVYRDDVSEVHAVGVCDIGASGVPGRVEIVKTFD